jgi:hypothetical protein
MSSALRSAVVSVALSLTAAFLVWNGVFGLHVSRGEKQYLLEEARFRLGEHPAPSMSTIMADTVRDGVWRATSWGAVVFVLALAASHAATRQPR